MNNRGRPPLSLPSKEIVQKFNEGLSLSELAEEYQCSRPPIRAILKDNKSLLNRPLNTRPISQKALAIYSHFEHDKCYSTTAKRFNVSRQYVYKLVNTIKH